MFEPNFSYARCVERSEQVAWKLDEIFPVDTDLDFSRAFLPDTLALTSSVGCLSSEGQRYLNQIGAKSYLNLFAFVEEYIVQATIEYLAARGTDEGDAIRALSRFADEEIKHQQLFGRYGEAFDRGFGHRCETLDSAAEVAKIILSKSPIAVLFTTMHIELMTLGHYTECVRDDTDIDPLFSKLLKCHWLEESQHAQLDALELGRAISQATPEDVDQAFEEYFGILEAFDGLLGQQAQMDLNSLSAKLGRELTAEESDAVSTSQHRAYRKTFLVSGLSNPTWSENMQEISPAGQTEAKRRAEAYLV